MPSPHATKDDLIGDDPAYRLAPRAAVKVGTWSDDEIERQLERASDIVDDLTDRANYEVDADGLAVDANLAAGLRMATCAVIELWIEVGEDNDIDGLAAEQISVDGFTGKRAPEATRRVLRPLKRVGLLAQPGTTRGGR